jgi:predicted dehydrogenase
MTAAPEENERVNRRHFLKAAAGMAAASAWSTMVPTTTSIAPIGIAIIGLGFISDLFMQACETSKMVAVRALVTGHPEKGRHYAAKYGVPQSCIYSYENFDRIRSNHAVEAVYIGLPNSMHCPFTLRAASAGKHVLCEKPMAISSQECRNMITACLKAAVKLMVGYRCHYDPTWLRTQELLRTGSLGRIVAFEGSFGFNIKPGVWRLDRHLSGGGSLFDVGIYPLNSVRFLSGEQPQVISAVAATLDDTSGRFREMEESLACLLRLPSGAIASIDTTYGASLPGSLRIHGEHGSLSLARAFDYDATHLVGEDGVQVEAISSSDTRNQFRLMAESFATDIRQNRQPATPGREGLIDLLAIEAIYRAAHRTTVA